MQKINVNLYGGKGLFGGREKPLEAEEIYCSCPEKCSYYQNGHCLLCRTMFGPNRCQFGGTKRIEGYTSRARKYWEFRDKYQKDPVYSKLNYPSAVVASIGDVLYIRTGYVEVRKRREDDDVWRRDVNGYMIKDAVFGNGELFIPKEDVTNELLYAIFKTTPHSLMGEKIDRWAKERVPEILNGLRRYAPDIHERFLAEYPEYDVAMNYTGKKAYIDSLKPGTEFKHDGKMWLYDGEYVESKDEIDVGIGSPWAFQGGSKTRVRFKVTPEMQFKVEDNSIIDDDVRFA